MKDFDSTQAALDILSRAKLDALGETIDRGYRNARRMSGEPESMYDAMEAWRTASNAWTYLLRSL